MANKRHQLIGASGDARMSYWVCDTFVGMPVAGLSTGDLAYAIDNDTFYTWDGVAWDAVGGGVTDHGALTGLGDDDHTQYLTRWTDTINPSDTGTQNNWSPTNLDGADVIAWSGAGTLTLTGLDKTYHTQGEVIFLQNTTAAEDIILNFNDGASLAGNRFYTWDGANLTISPQGTVILFRDDDYNNRWLVIGGGGGGVTDHGALTGLGDDDHTQYATNAEFDDHSARHESAGADAIKLDDLAAPDDNTDLDVSTSKHGLTPKAPNDTTKFLRGDATWAVPAGGGGALHMVWSSRLTISAGTQSRRLYVPTGTWTITECYFSLPETNTGTTIVDVHKNGTTVYTTQGNRPTVTTGIVSNRPAPDVTALTTGDYLECFIDQKGGARGRVQVYIIAEP